MALGGRCGERRACPEGEAGGEEGRAEVFVWLCSGTFPLRLRALPERGVLRGSGRLLHLRVSPGLPGEALRERYVP